MSSAVDRNDNDGDSTVASFACDCKKKFPSIRALSSHVRQDHDGQLFVCELCCKTFLTTFLLKRHVQLRHSDGGDIFACQVCRKTFEFKKALTNHLKSHEIERRFCCDKCDRTFKTRAHLVNHKDMHEDGGVYDCHECGAKFFTRNSLMKHLPEHGHGFGCVDCEKTFRTHRAQKIHFVAAHCGNDRMCKVCNNKFPDNEPVCGHLKALNEARLGRKVDENGVFLNSENLCGGCQGQFQAATDLDDHLSVIIAGFAQKCLVCAEEFTNKCALLHHVRMLHMASSPYLCTVCGAVFKSRSGHLFHRMNKHTHEKSKRYTCSYCAASFNRRYRVVQHERTHTKERPFICHICGHSFSNKAYLSRHFFYHSTERPYKCDVCGKRLRCQYNLRLHQNTHTGQKPFACSHCPKKFSQRGVWQKHEATHDSSWPGEPSASAMAAMNLDKFIIYDPMAKRQPANAGVEGATQLSDHDMYDGSMSYDGEGADPAYYPTYT